MNANTVKKKLSGLIQLLQESHKLGWESDPRTCAHADTDKTRTHTQPISLFPLFH